MAGTSIFGRYLIAIKEPIGATIGWPPPRLGSVRIMLDLECRLLSVKQAWLGRRGLSVMTARFGLLNGMPKDRPRARAINAREFWIIQHRIESQPLPLQIYSNLYSPTQPAVRSIRHQIVVVAQCVLDVERRASRCVGISSARGHHTQGPIILSALIRDVIYCDVADV
jgi:hypothetical protein